MNPVKIIGYGNPGRQDDGIAEAMIEKIQQWLDQQTIGNHVTAYSCYQLNIEDAERIADADLVFFIDASRNQVESYQVTEIKPDQQSVFTSHGVSPQYVVGLCEALYFSKPLAYLLEIKGYEWEFREELSSGASRNIAQAFRFLTDFLCHRYFKVLN